MAITKEVLKKFSFLRDGEVLIDFVHFLAGLIVAREGFLKLQDLWLQLQPHLPLSFHTQISDKILTWMPVILKTFITVVGSICAVVVGVLWILSGLYGLIRRHQDIQAAPELGQPELAAESLRTGKPVHILDNARLASILRKWWPGGTHLGPVSREVIREVLRTLGRIALIWLLIALIMYFFGILPDLLQKYVQVRVNILVPSAAPLYVLLGLVAFFNCLIGLSLVPFKQREFSRGYEAARVLAKGETELFFALLEESCRLLDRLPGSQRRTARMELTDEPNTKGALIESSPEPIRALARPAAYVCLPLALLFLTMGFSRLIHFTRPAFPMGYAEFLSYHALDYVLEAAFAVALIAAGTHFMEWARRLFDIQVFRSSLVFCRLQPEAMSATNPQQQSSDTDPFVEAPLDKWRAAEGVGERFATWATAPQHSDQFKMELFWAEALSESVTSTEPRFLIDLQVSEALETSMKYIVELPFATSFQRIA